MVNSDGLGQMTEQNKDPHYRRDTPFIRLPATFEEEVEEYPDYTSDDEEYLDDEEPYGAFMMPSPNPYNRAKKVEEANRALFSGPKMKRHVPAVVKILEENNRYYSEDETDSEWDNPDPGTLSDTSASDTSVGSGSSNHSSTKSNHSIPEKKTSVHYTANGDDGNRKTT
uniref:Uncharacterized protein n=1 Tax=Homalodisca liturata TaxID=320908 RepID=A0A1B6HCF6_9HEMI